MTPTDPFSTLGIEPTLDVATIKRAYFGALRTRGPQRDPIGFRTIRKAYEELQDGHTRTRAYARHAQNASNEHDADAWGQRFRKVQAQALEFEAVQARAELLARVLTEHGYDHVRERLLEAEQIGDVERSLPDAESARP